MGWSPLTAVNRKSRANNALKALRAKVMITDAELTIESVSDSLVAFLSEAEPDLKRHAPRFSVAALVGSRIDVLCEDAELRRTLASIERPHEARIRLGERAFDLVATPLLSGGKRIGLVIEWSDALERVRALEDASRLAALGRSQAMIEFTPEGVVLDANENFLKVTGYALDEIRGQHHRMFVEEAERNAPSYGAFWQTLRSGQFKADELKRIGKNGRVFHIQASYNPVVDEKGRVVKVIKYAVDVTKRVEDAQRVQTAIAELAAGNLLDRITEPLSPGFDAIRTDFNRAVEKLQDSLLHVRSGSEGIARRTEEIRASTDDLSKRTEQQAASLEETAAALNEVTKTVTRTSEGAQRASTIVGTAKQSAENSAEVVREAIEAMKGIEASSRQIGQIIGVIDEIAFQTNLLALNAGVEAARAGDAGRGFAVVASEVRALAQRSADAAKQIKSLIQTSVGQVDQGVSLVCRTGEVLTKIVEQVADISTVVSGIASSAQEQATALTEVNTVVAEMDRTTQQNAAMVEETTAATHSLAQESAEVTTLIQQFRLADGPSAKVIPHRLPERPRARAVDRPAPRALAPSQRLAALRPAGAAARAAAPKMLAPPVAEPEWQEF